MTEPAWRRVFRLPFGSRRSVERNVDDELAFHVAMREEALRRSGVPERQAHAAALDRFGDHDRIRDECIAISSQHAREVRFMEGLDSVLSDLRYGFRSLRARPGFTMVAALTLSLGIGATAAMFSLVDGILLRPLPYPQSDRLVAFAQAFPEKGLERWNLSPLNFATYRDRVRSFSAAAGYVQRDVTLDNHGEAERVPGAFVTADFFHTLGVGPALGRAFTAAEDTPGANQVVILSYGFWQSHFGGARQVLEQTLTVGGTPMRVVGVMPPNFAFPSPAVRLFMPLGLDPALTHPYYLLGVARLTPGATVDAARREATDVMWDWARATPGLLGANVDPSTTHMAALVAPLRDALTGSVARPLATLQAAVVVLLLIALANVATLLSSRGSTRAREMTMRTALGATRGRVIRQLLTESVALALLGGAAGIVLAFVLVRAFTHSPTVTLPRLETVGVDGRVLAFTVAVSLVSGLIFGLAPTLHVVRESLATGMASQRSSGSGAARRVNNGLVITQLALSFVLLVSAGLVLKSFRHLLQADLGFEPRGVTAIAMPVSGQKYMDRSRIAALATDVADRAQSLPGVRDAAVMFPPIYANDVNSDGYLVEGHAPPAAAGSETQTVQISVTPGAFRTLQIPMLYGRDFTPGDVATSQPVVIVDATLAQRYWLGADAVGKRIRMTGDTTWLTIVGVVGSVRDADVAAEPRAHTYFPYTQDPGSRPTLVVRTSGDVAPVIAEVRAAVRQADPTIPLDNVQPLTESISKTLAQRRLTELLLGGFAAIALLLSSIGIYGVMSLYVAARYREFGVRLAVGAAPAALARLVMRQGVSLAGAGVALGVIGALIATRWVQGLLYHVSATDPLVFGGLGATLLAVAAVSCYLPARRAARSDPVRVLRAD